MTTANAFKGTEQRADCPGCHGDMVAEPDHRWPSGWAWYCPRADCSEAGGCWPVSLGELRRAERLANYQFQPA